MSAKRLAILVVLVAVPICSGFAQTYERSELLNELSVTVGRTFVSTQSIRNATGFDPRIHFGNEESVDFDYGRLLKSRSLAALYGELPVAIYPRMDLNAVQNGIPKDIGALFITPSARLNFFPEQGISPWVSAGLGYGRFREAPTLNFFGTNPGPTGTNTFVLQFGIGLDIWPWRGWGARVEARDFYSGAPALNVDTGRSRQHNYYVGVGVIRRF